MRAIAEHGQEFTTADRLAVALRHVEKAKSMLQRAAFLVDRSRADNPGGVYTNHEKARYQMALSDRIDYLGDLAGEMRGTVKELKPGALEDDPSIMCLQ